MRYLGTLRGTGDLTRPDGSTVAVRYEFDGYIEHSGRVTGGGEIRLPKEAAAFPASPRERAMFTTEDGRRIEVRFADTKQPPSGGVRLVDIIGGVPPASVWRS